jgi:small-conductance mechanosensitive channel
MTTDFGWRRKMSVRPEPRENRVTAAPLHALTPAERRRRISLGLLRAAVVTAVLIGAYYLAPLSQLSDVPVALSLIVGLIALTAVATWQLKAVVRARHPGIRAIQALATTAPLFLLLFATSYFLMAQAETDSFSVHPLTRTDTLYFTVTVFATVGFGDISPASQAARLLVIVQMILDLLVLGLGIQVFVGAAKRGRERSDG